jgi:hypothetical protein
MEHCFSANNIRYTIDCHKVGKLLDHKNVIFGLIFKFIHSLVLGNYEVVHNWPVIFWTAAIKTLGGELVKTESY